MTSEESIQRRRRDWSSVVMADFDHAGWVPRGSAYYAREKLLRYWRNPEGRSLGSCEKGYSGLDSSHNCTKMPSMPPSGKLIAYSLPSAAIMWAKVSRGRFPVRYLLPANLPSIATRLARPGKCMV
jgi:hypothetical protein